VAVPCHALAKMPSDAIHKINKHACIGSGDIENRQGI